MEIKKIEESKVGTEISLKGVIKAIFDDCIHVQIGNKIVPIKNNDVSFNN